MGGRSVRAEDDELTLEGDRLELRTDQGVFALTTRRN